MSLAHPEWRAVAVLPNIELTSALESGYAAMVPRNDPRVRDLTQSEQRLQEFLDRFTDTFGQCLSPTVLIVRADAPDSTFQVESITSFRDSISLATISFNRAKRLLYPRRDRITFSDAFWLYPWMLDRRGQALVGRTPAMLGYHSVDAFHGQSSPGVPIHKLAKHEIDLPILGTVFERWRAHYTTVKREWRDVALFRSLNMANQASLMPAEVEINLYDVGRSIALWVSAFEILAHPGESKTGPDIVYDLLAQIDWLRPHCREKRYKAYTRGNRPTIRRNLACWLYGELYRRRNDFLHGNPVKVKDLMLKRSGRNLFQYTGPLYRMALASFLRLDFSQPVPSMDDPEAFGNHVANKMEFEKYQLSVEESLLTARTRAQP